MSKVTFSAFFILLLISLSDINSDPLDNLLFSTLDEMIIDNTNTIAVGLGVFHFSDKSIAGNFSYYLENKLSIALKENNKFELVDRDKLDEILEEIRFGLSGLADETTTIEPGRLKGLQAIISCRYYNESNNVRVFMELLNLETGTVTSVKEILIPKNLIPEGIHFIPENYSDALFVLDEISELNNSDNDLLQVKAWTKRGNGGTYQNGENLVVNFYSNKDCYLKIYHIDVEGKISLIFPNHVYSDNFIQAQRIYKIPDRRYNFTFSLGSPFGTEFIKVIASVNQFEYIENSFEELGSINDEFVSKGLTINVKEEEAAQILISYTIIE